MGDDTAPGPRGPIDGDPSEHDTNHRSDRGRNEQA
jgi:hypothetical protein